MAQSNKSTCRVMAARAKVSLIQPEIILFMKENRKDTSDKLFDVKLLVCTSLTDGEIHHRCDQSECAMDCV